MRIALIASPFIPIPPRQYGGTELFIAQLALGLTKAGHEVIVYASGDSELPVEVRWLYPRCEWPISDPSEASLKENNHTAWAIRDAINTCDIMHVNSLVGLPYSRFTDVPFVYTVHHAYEKAMAEFYANYPNIQYVAISEFQRQVEKLPGMKTIHHGIDLLDYTLRKKKQRYLAFLGRLAPMKGTHLAIQIAQKARIPLKIAGEIQPMYREYYEREVKPHIDGNFIEYIGEVNLKEKNELLGNALAMLFPIQWNEPFGLVTIESMACGTPVLAMPGGSVGELVENGVSGFVASSVDELAGYATQLETLIKPELVRGYVERNFTVEKMTAHYEDLYKSIVSEKSVDAVSRLFETSDQEASAA